jgi:hypothetical protein
MGHAGETAGSSGMEKYAPELNMFLAKVHMRLAMGTEVVPVRPFDLSSANRFRLNLKQEPKTDI